MDTTIIRGIFRRDKEVRNSKQTDPLSSIHEALSNTYGVYGRRS